MQITNFITFTATHTHTYIYIYIYIYYIDIQIYIHYIYMYVCIYIIDIQINIDRYRQIDKIKKDRPNDKICTRVHWNFISLFFVPQEKY